MSRNALILSRFLLLFFVVHLSFLLIWRLLSGGPDYSILLLSCPALPSASCVSLFRVHSGGASSSLGAWRLNAVIQLTSALLCVFHFSLSSIVLLLLFLVVSRSLSLAPFFPLSHVYVFQMIALSRSLRFIFAFSFSLPRRR